MCIRDSYIYSGEDLPLAEQPKSPEEQYKELCALNEKSIAAIKAGIANNELSTAAEAWYELSEETMTALWKAPKNGGCFTTSERAVMKTPEFRESFYGVSKDS